MNHEYNVLAELSKYENQAYRYMMEPFTKNKHNSLCNRNILNKRIIRVNEIRPNTTTSTQHSRHKRGQRGYTYYRDNGWMVSLHVTKCPSRCRKC